MTANDDARPPTTTTGVSRRTVMITAAWAAPVVMAVGWVPAEAASGPANPPQWSLSRPTAPSPAPGPQG